MRNPYQLPLLYGEFAAWWPLLSAPERYAQEAAFYAEVILKYCGHPPHTVLELGSGGGNNAFHLKKHFQMTLLDISPQMLAVSSKLNPDCEHLQGEMRDVRLGRQFDAVFIHDAIMYMTTRADLRRAIDTAFAHCREGGVGLFVPDCTRETFKPSTDHGGCDAEEQAMRYLEWVWDPDPHDDTFLCDMAYLLREGDQAPRCVCERHVLGLFSQGMWLHIINDVGFEGRALAFPQGQDIPASGHVFVGSKAKKH
jgi:SAM-dependent methyltransferase